MGMYNFDEITDRRGTNSLKWDIAENELPMWVADMDFRTAPEIIDALEQRVSHGIFGYTIIPDEFTIAAAVLSLIFAVIDLFTAQNFITTWYAPILGGLCGGAVLIVMDLFSTLIFKKTGFGFGDVKLLAALGVMFGFKYIFILLVLACFAAAFHFVVIIFAGKAKKGIYLPMGPYICVGAWLVIILQPYFESVMNMYKSLMEMQVLP